MWHLNTLDKLVVKFNNDHHNIMIFLLVIIFGVLFVWFLHDFNVNSRHSNNYTKGYSDGFNDLNVTKYNTAVAVYGHNQRISNPFNQQYVDGYIDGYNDALLQKANQTLGANFTG
jgi:hypothetical protein